jgi:hypothetical protein
LVNSPFTFEDLPYGEEFLAPCPTPQLEGHHLTTVSDSLFTIFTAILEAISTGNQRTHHAVVTRDQLNVEYVPLVLKIDFCHLLKAG